MMTDTIIANGGNCCQGDGETMATHFLTLVKDNEAVSSSTPQCHEPTTPSRGVDKNIRVIVDGDEANSCQDGDETMVVNFLASMKSNETISLDPSQSHEQPSAGLDKYSLDNMIQASELPHPNYWELNNRSESISDLHGEMVWDSRKALGATGQVELLESIVPRDRRESALNLLHGNDYQIDNEVLCKVMQDNQTRSLNWSPKAKKLFSETIANEGEKNFEVVSKRLKRKAGDCQAYYYAAFKGTRDYRKMKRSRRRQVKTRSSDNGGSSDEYVRWCNVEGDVIRCDICTSTFSLQSISTTKDMPLGNYWFCNECDPKDD